MRPFLALIFVFSWNILFAQTENIAINNDGSSADPSAILDIKSINKGVAFPRMTTVQRNSIADPTTGLIIYNIDTDCLEYYAGLLWLEICGEIAAANTYPSGIYVSEFGNDETGDGTPANPYNTIVKGLQEMANGDTLRVAVGNYNENNIEIFQKSDFVIIGDYNSHTWKSNASGNTKIVMKANSFFTINESSGILLQDLRIVGNPVNQTNTSSYGVKILESTSITLDSCWVDSRNGYSQLATNNQLESLTKARK